PSHRTLRILDVQHLQFGRQRPSGRVDGDDADLDPFGQGRVDPSKLDPSASLVAVPGRERLAFSLELEEEGTLFEREPARDSQATARAQLVIDVRMMSPLDQP